MNEQSPSGSGGGTPVRRSENLRLRSKLTVSVNTGPGGEVDLTVERL